MRPTSRASSMERMVLRGEALLSAEELASVAGIGHSTLERLVRLGLVEPTAGGTNEFTAATAARLKRMLRLHGDLGIDLFAAVIILDLLERMERLEAELARLRGGS